MAKTIRVVLICFSFLVFILSILNMAGVTNARSEVSLGLFLVIVCGLWMSGKSDRVQDPFSLRRIRNIVPSDR